MRQRQGQTAHPDSVGDASTSTSTIAIAGALSAEVAPVLVRGWGRAMAAAPTVTPPGMSAVGGHPAAVFAWLDTFGLAAANRNGEGQVVPARPLVEWLVEDGYPVSPGQPLARLHPEAAH